MAIFFPERVNRLILIDTIPPNVFNQVRNDSFKTLIAIKDIPLLPYLVISGRNKNSIKQILRECIYDTQLITPELLDRQYQLSKMKGMTWVLYSTLKNADEAKKLKDSLSQVHHPTLLIWGERDLVFPPSVGKDLHRAIKGSKFQTIKGSGHIPMWENPEEVNQTILRFLKKGPL